MAVCRATKRDGTPCTLPANGKQGLFCWAHSPDTAEARRKRASRGGKGKAARRVSMLWDEVRGVIDGVEHRRLTPAQGNTMIRGYNTLIELAKLQIEEAELEIAQRRLELDVEERTELVREIEELRALADARVGGDKWPA